MPTDARCTWHAEGMRERGSPSWLRRMLVTEGSVYGLILVAGMVVVSRNLTARSIDAVLTVLATVLVFYAAHVYAATVAALAGDGAEDARPSVGAALRAAMLHSAGMLVVAVLPLLALFLGVWGLLGHSDAIWAALLIDVVLLAGLGWLVTALRTRAVWARVGGAVLTAAFGGVLILLKVLIHG